MREKQSTFGRSSSEMSVPSGKRRTQTGALVFFALVAIFLRWRLRGTWSSFQFLDGKRASELVFYMEAREGIKPYLARKTN